MRRLPTLSFLLLLLMPLIGMGQGSKGTLTGRVTDSTGAVIQNAAVRLTPSGLSATSDSLGEFVLPAIPAGVYTVKATSVGFSASTKSVTVAASQTAHVDMVLSVASGSEQVVVSAGIVQDMLQAVNEEITSPNIVQVMPESEILALPNANVADAIGRMAGVTLQRDEGEGVYVQVRGLDPRLTNVTIDGVTIPSPEATIRQVNLATIPSDMIRSIELNKTLSANQDADGIGGSVNLVTKTAGELPTFTIDSTLGYTPIENTRYVGKVDTTLGKRFGAAKRWGIIMGAGYDYNGRGINDIEPQPDLNPDGTTTPYYDSVTLREYRYQRLRWGGTMGADYKINNHSNLAAHVILSDFKDWGDKWYYELNDGGKPKFYESSRKPDFAIGSFSLSGNHIYNSIWVHWGSAVSRSRELNSGGNPEVSFSTVGALKSYDEANCNYAGTSPKSIYLPQWSAACMHPNSTPADNTFNLQNYTINQFITTTGQAVQLNLQEWAGAGINYRVGKHSATLEFGGEFRNARKFQNAYTPTYDYNGSSTADNFQSAFADPNYYSGNYHNGPFTDYDKLTSYFAANPGLFSLEVATTAAESSPNNFDLIERVSAGYVMNTINWDHFRLQTGLRLEDTYVVADGYSSDASGNVTPVSTTQSYIDPLPSIQARWAATPLTAIRAVYARGLSRPNFYDLVPYFVDNGAGSVPRYSVGNPKEQPTHANNYDLLLEQQLKPFGVIQAGYFYKTLIDPIVSVYVPCSSAANAPCSTTNTNGYPDLASQNVNASNASVSGLEFNWQQKLTNLPGFLSGLGIMANYAYTTSHTHGILGRTDDPPLIGQAKHAFNIEPSYERKRFSAHTGISYNSANDNAYTYFNNTVDPTFNANSPGPSNGPWGDNYFYPHMQIDAQASARLYKGLMLVINGLNLNNEVFGFYNGSPQYMTQREYYKPTYSATLHWNFRGLDGGKK
ncbi:MAG: TonB-dependent receptor [Terracidiphilus sp.]|jgi:TonB-dependent receptor